MEFMAFPAWKLSVGEAGSDLKDLAWGKKKIKTHAGLTLPAEAGKAWGGYYGLMYV